MSYSLSPPPPLHNPTNTDFCDESYFNIPHLDSEQYNFTASASGRFPAKRDKCRNSRWQRQDPCRIDPVTSPCSSPPPHPLLFSQSIPSLQRRRLPDCSLSIGIAISVGQYNNRGEKQGEKKGKSGR